MDVDMNVLRMIESEREISLEVLVTAIEQALQSAYQRTPGALPEARVELDRRSGHVTVYARERIERPVPEDLGTDDEEPGADEPPAAPGYDLGPEFDHTPDNFGRIATATARQVIMQRLRDAEDDQVLGAFRGRQDELIAGVIQ